MAHAYHVWLTEHVQNIIQKDFAIKPHLMSMDLLNTVVGALPTSGREWTRD